MTECNKIPWYNMVIFRMIYIQLPRIATLA
jgi:hypothetical protein